jgi:hypothetical protein
MKKLDAFTLKLDKKREMPVEVLADSESTIVIIDCSCCEEFVSSRLPGGVLIPIASALKTFFEERGMRNTSVDMDGNEMRRTYKGVIENDDLSSMKRTLESAVSKFTKKRRSR